jgi:hypothetical protein
LFNVELLYEVGDGFSTCVLLCDDSKQVLPSNPDGFYCGDGILITAPVWYDMQDEGNNLYVVAWNRGGVYNHSVNIMLSVKGVDEPDTNSIQVMMIETIDRLITLMRSIF